MKRVNATSCTSASFPGAETTPTMTAIAFPLGNSTMAVALSAVARRRPISWYQGFNSSGFGPATFSTSAIHEISRAPGCTARFAS